MSVKPTLVLHFEPVEDAGHSTWWTDSPDVPGFYAAAPSLGQLQRETLEALRWSLDDEALEIEWTAEGEVPEWAAAHVGFQPGLSDASLAGNAPHRHGQVHTHQTFNLHGRHFVVRLTEDKPGNFTLNV